MFKYKQYGSQSLNNYCCMKNQNQLYFGAGGGPIYINTNNGTTYTDEDVQNKQLKYMNSSAQSCRMKYAQQVKTYGTTESSTSFPKKTCSIGGPTFSY